MRLVIKFGGTSVGTSHALHNAAGIVKREAQAGREVCVVTSAMSGVTDQLVKFTDQSLASMTDETIVMQIMDFVRQLEDRHVAAITEIIQHPQLREETIVNVGEECRMLERVLMGLCFLGEVSPSARDLVHSAGERLAAQMLAGIVRSVGVAAQAVKGAEAGILTDEHWGEAVPNIPETRKRVPRALMPLISKGIIPVVTGFYGATPAGRPALLGRGGSDYVAGIIGDALDADEVWIMTDVDGIRATDPRIVPDAPILDVVSWQEAIELAYFGAKVLHPKTLVPLREKGIPSYVKNTFQPEARGTLASFERPSADKPVRVIANREGIALVNVASTLPQQEGMDLIETVLKPLRQADVPFYVEARSPAQAQSVIALEERHAKGLKDSSLPGGISAEIIGVHGMITLVGEGILGNPKVVETFVAALSASQIRIHAILGNPGGCSVSAMIPAGRSTEAVKLLYDRFMR